MRNLTVSSSAVLMALCTLLVGGCGGTTGSDPGSDPSIQGDNLGAGQGAPAADDTAVDGGAGPGGGSKKITICHIPPGNHANAHSITVGVAALPAHLRHGDTLGACGGDDADAGTSEDGGVSEPDAGSEGGEDGGSSGDVDAGPACFPEGSECDPTAPNPCCNRLTCSDGLCVPVIG